MRITSFFLAILAGLATGNEERSLRRKNDPVCHKVKTSGWWAARRERRDPNLMRVQGVDDACKLFNHRVDECKTARKVDGKNVRCEIVGTGSTLCRGNVCNHLNDGTCNLENTFGECMWIREDQYQIYNDFWKKNQDHPYAKDLLLSKGCYRNPCNMAGYGKPQNAAELCESLSVPNLYRCTWCSIPGEAMGCQLSNAYGPDAECADVIDGIRRGEIEKSGVVVREVVDAAGFDPDPEKKCQCSTEFPLCKAFTDQGTLNAFYRPLYPPEE